MTLRSGVSFLAVVSLITACSDSTTPSATPRSLAGEYTYITLTSTADFHSPQSPPYPAGSAGSFIVDSVHDDIQLLSDMTYTESGLLAGHTPVNPMFVDLGATGTYTVAGDTVTLTPATGTFTNTWVGTIVNDTLVLSRYPGTWTLSKSGAR
jgi:hypothetical protein